VHLGTLGLEAAFGACGRGIELLFSAEEASITTVAVVSDGNGFPEL